MSYSTRNIERTKSTKTRNWKEQEEFQKGKRKGEDRKKIRGAKASLLIVDDLV